MRSREIPLLLAGLSGIFPLYAQVTDPDGPIPPALNFGSAASSYALTGIDQINYFNGSLNIGIPLVNFTGRSDTPQNLILTVQNTWRVEQSTQGPVPSSVYGQQQYSPAGLLNVQYSYVGNGSSCAQVLTWVVWSASSGHANLADEAHEGQPGTGGIAGCASYDRGRVFHSYEGSGLTYVSDANIGEFGSYPGIGTLYFPNGTRYVFNNDHANPATILDRNGNRTQIQLRYGAIDCEGAQIGVYTITDSAGRTVTINFTNAPDCGSDSITYTGSDQSGAPLRTIHVYYGQLHTLLIPGLPLGPQAQYPSCLFPQLTGSSQTPYDPPVIQSVVLPDGNSYSFLYDYYGGVAQMTLPTGAAIQYKWPYPSSCSDPGGISGAHVWGNGYATIYRRVLERDEYANGIGGGLTGKITYSATSLGSANNGPDTNHPTRSGGFGTRVDADFQDGSGNQLRHETHSFYGDPVQPESIPANPTFYPNWSDGLEYQTQISQGGVTRQSQQKLWQQQPCSGCWFNQPPATADTAQRMDSPFVCQANTSLDSPVSSIVTTYERPANIVTGLYEYDFGSAPAFGTTCPTTPPSNFLRATLYSYWFDSHPEYGPPTMSALTNVNLVNLPSYKVVYNGGSIEYFNYDETAPLPAAGAPGHDDANFDTSYNTRGNLTTHLIYQSETASFPQETFTWDMTGRQLSHKDFNSHTTMYMFGDTAHVYPTLVTNALGQRSSYSYDAHILKIRSATDEDNQATTQFNYNGDPLDRLTSVVRANGSQTAWTYPSPTQVTVKQDQITSGDGTLETDTILDGLGRQARSVVYENAGSTITTGTNWDALGRATLVSNPYRSGDSVYTTGYTYDALNRTKCVTASFDLAQSCTNYSGNTAMTTDPAGHSKTTVSDAAGRVVSVTEDPGSLSYATTYQYNVFDELTSVTQGAQARSFFFDSSGRLGTAVNPENGTTTYRHDNNGNVTSRTDNSGSVATYTYDALDRINTVIYSGPRPAPAVQYFYDTGATNAKGRLVSVGNAAGTYQQITGYDAVGRVTGSSETVGGTAEGSFGYTYNLADALVSTTYPSGRVVTNSYDNANRISAVTGSGKTYVSNATYAAFGGIAGFNYAVTNSGVPAGTRTFSYNGRLQLGEMSDQGASRLDLQYFYGTASTVLPPGSSSALNNGNPTGVVETARKGSGTSYSFTQTYGYDSLNRLNAAFDTGGWAQSFSFDRYGNPWTTVNFGLPPDRLPTSNVYSATTNRSSYAGTGYDAGGVGNQVTMGSVQLTFDGENRIVQAYDTVTFNSTCFGYDALGQRVYKQTFGGNTCTGTPATTAIYVYDAFGNLMRQVETATGGGTIPPTPCLTCYLTWDHLGSVRMVSDTVPGGFTSFHDYAPFGGEVLANAGRTSDWGPGTDYLRQRYTGAERDTETTLDFLQARYLANLQARFISADPAGNAAADLINPQSWNLYSYTANNPLEYIDPTGTNWFTDFFSSFGSNVAAWFGYCPGVCFYDEVYLPGDTGLPVGISGGGTTRGGGGGGGEGAMRGPGGGTSGPPPSQAPSNVNKNYPLTTPCAASASQTMGAVEGNFSRFGNYSAGPLSVTFSPPSGMHVGSTIPISVGIFGVTQNMGVRVNSISSQRMTFDTLPGGHLFYPGSITFASSAASQGSINFNINLTGTFNGATNRAKYFAGGAFFEDAQWNHFLGQVSGFCKAGR